MFQEVSRELLRLGYQIRFRPAGQSMQPTIRDGEPVTVAPVNTGSIKRGDILLYCTPKCVIAHRVIGIESDRLAGRYFILRGDASVSTDKPVAARQVLGQVVCVERDGRTINLAGRSARVRHNATRWAMKIKSYLAPVRRQMRASIDR